MFFRLFISCLLLVSGSAATAQQVDGAAPATNTGGKVQLDAGAVPVRPGPVSATASAPVPASSAQTRHAAPEHNAAAPSAATQSPAVYARLPVCRLDSHDATRLAVEPCRTAPPQMPPRRAVAQQLARMPDAPVLDTGNLGGAIASPVARDASAGPALPRSTLPSAPSPIVSCDSGACSDSNGVRHNGNATGVTIDPSGKTCTRNGVWLQCF